MTIDVQLTPENLTFDHIKSWDAQTMRQYMGRPEMRAAILTVVQNRPLAEVQEVQTNVDIQQVDEAAKQAAEQQAEQVRIAEEQQRIVAEQEAARKAAEEAARPKKIVVDYQIKDEDGNPIGRPTHLEAATEAEMRDKMMEAHVQATRAFHRLKKQKISFKEQPTTTAVITAPSDTELLAAMKDLKSDDPQKQLDAVRKVNQSELGRIQAEADVKIAEANELRRQEQVSYQFLRRHQKDFNNCEANINLVKNYFEENQLAWTLDNLEIAFHALESELAPVEVPAAPVTPANPVPVAPAPTAPVVQATVVSTPAAPPVVQPQVTATVQAQAPANPVPAAPRPGVNAGLVPGQSSGSRPVTSASNKLTAEEIRSWDGPTMRAKMRNPQIRAQIEAFFAERNKNR